MMQNKFFKIILIVAVAMITLASITYFARTVIDVGCAKTAKPEDSSLNWKRRFVNVNCWYWERTIQLQQLQFYKF
jgi:flagellar basal body-associated protein FliL